MSADDVAYSINRILDPNLKPNPSPVSGGFFGNIVGASEVLGGKAKTASGIKVIDPATIEFDLVNADATFLNVMATPFASVVPKELAGPDATVFSAKPVGTGPYLFKSYAKGQGAVFGKNQSYWQAGQPYLDEIDYKTGQDDNSMLQQIEYAAKALAHAERPGDRRAVDRVHRRAARAVRLTRWPMDWVYGRHHFEEGGRDNTRKQRQLPPCAS